MEPESSQGKPSTDINYPVFVLAFCIFNKQEYIEQVSPAIKKFKFDQFGHDMVLLHENELKIPSEKNQ